MDVAPNGGDPLPNAQGTGGATFNGSAPFLGIEPNGRAIDMRAVDVFQLDSNRKVLTNTVYYDDIRVGYQRIGCD